ncbi:MAG: bifunctional diaminohydroxyphosphoribosylaminopyrimidine deaminase/5-amino-6-(5-phosphoribosylamino)uracil reductase RibD [Brumimicrobium sp.]|nr:bifunctional diaminohydroxyphosphoribosylaminopyrimidine deaminase/5-amino-6-(5-phosphoribosylamino)uracil reductase RibD [Brumimicrobium sp.]
MNEQEIKDIQYMHRALQLAEFGGVQVAPNPMVGAVIVCDDKIIGEGYHQKYGEAHAEVHAVQSVKDISLLSQATIYVTLEPCAHHGKTPPCADLIVRHHFKRVVVACRDINPKVSGKGIQHIKDAGIEVTEGILEKEARELNKRFFTFHGKGRPFVILKWAETQDGFMDRLPEDRKEGINWITHSRMKLYVHTWRSKEQAIIVGWKTINNDNPQLNVRKIAGSSPLRFIIDPHGKSNPDATVFKDGNPTFVFTTKTSLPDLPSTVETITLPIINSLTILHELYKRNILSVFIEGGKQTLEHFIEEDYWDEAYQLIGNTTFTRGVPAPTLKNRIFITFESVENDFIQYFIHI